MNRSPRQLDDTSENIILKDFTEFHKAGLTNPLMDEIEKTFATPQ